VAGSVLPILLQALGELEQELTRHAAVLLGPAIELDRSASAARLRLSLGRLKTATEAMRDRILESATELSVDRIESAYRARSRSLQIQLQELWIAAPDVEHLMWPGRFQSLGDVSAYLLEAIGRVDATWLEHRRFAGDVSPSCRPRTLIHAAAAAESALLAVGRDADLVSFLSAGVTVGSEPFRTACRVISALLNVTPVAIASHTLRNPSLVGRISLSAVTFASTSLTDEEER